MEPIKNALSQASNLVQQAAHTVVEALRGGETEETTKDNVCLFNKNYINYFICLGWSNQGKTKWQWWWWKNRTKYW